MIIVFCILGLATLATDWTERSQTKAFFRSQFRLDENVAFVALDTGSGKIRWPSMFGMVEFDSSGFDRYVRDLNSAHVWTPRKFDYRNVADPVEYDPDAFSWRTDHFLPRRAGDRLTRWGVGSKHGVHENANGMNFCFALLKDKAAAPRSDGKVLHRGVSCASVRRDQEPTAVLKGRLDMERRRLFMIVI